MNRTRELLILGSTLFILRQGFWTNLHQFLHLQARARLGLDTTRASVRAAMADTLGFARLSSADRARWTRALDYYVANFGRKQAVSDSALIAINDTLINASPDKPPASLSADLRSVLEEAAIPYRAVWWPRHEARGARNRRMLDSLVERYGDSIAARIERAMRVSWGRPVVVDFTAYAGWANAYTTLHPTHITYGAADTTLSAMHQLETIFHESMHGLTDSIAAARRRVAPSSGKRVTPELDHAIIFYTAGAVMKSLFPDHVPAAETLGIWTGGLRAYKPGLDRSWPAYLRGELALDEAIARIIADIPP